MAAPTELRVTAKVTAIVVEKCDDYGCPFNHDDHFCMAAKKRFSEMSYLRPSAERMVDDLPDDCPLLSKPVLVRRAVEGAEKPVVVTATPTAAELNQRADGSWPGPGGESRAGEEITLPNAAGVTLTVEQYEVESTAHMFMAQQIECMRERLNAGWRCDGVLGRCDGVLGIPLGPIVTWWSRPKCAAKGSVGKG